MQISRGQRVRLADVGLSGERFKIQIALPTSGIVLDVACFGLDGSRKLVDERYMTFFNQKTSPCGAVKLVEGSTFELDLSRLPTSIDALSFTAAIDGAGVMASLGRGSVKFLSSGQIAADFAFDGSFFKDERAIVMLEIYRKDGSWRINAIAQGFSGGLDALIRHYGGTVSESPRPTVPAELPPAPPVAPPAPPAPPVSLAKVTLEKRGQSLSLQKTTKAGFGEIVLNLNWSSGSKKGLFGRTKGLDLDLGCLYELKDGAIGCVQALGNSFGDFSRAPYIRLSGDDRTGASVAGESIRINGEKIDEIRRILVFALIYDGAPNWKAANGVATVKVPGHPEIEVRMDSNSDRERFCVIALVANDAGQLRVTKEDAYFAGHAEADHAYRWGIRWIAGRK